VSAWAPPRLPFLRTLQARFLLALVVLGVLPLGIVGLTVAALDRQALVEQSARELTGLARGLAGELDIHVEDLMSIVRGVSVLPDVTSMDPDRQDAVLDELFLQYHAFARLTTFDLSGQRLVSSTAGGGAPIFAVEAFQAARQGREGWTVGPAPGTGRPSLLIMIPIRSAGRDVVGVLGAVVDLENLSAVIERVPIGAGGQAFALDAAGRVLLHPDRALVRERADYSMIGQMVGARPAGPGVVYYTLDGEERAAGYAPVASLGWTVLVERPAAVVFGPAERSWQVALAGLAISAILASLAAVWLARTLTRPVRDVAVAARALGAGDSAAPLPRVSPSDGELRGLVDAFAAMRQAVIAREEERTQFLAREQTARAEAQAAERRFAFLAEASRLLVDTLDVEATLDALARLAVPYLADLCIIAVVDEDGTQRALAVAHVDPERQAAIRERQQRYPPDPRVPRGVSKVLRTGEPEFFPVADDAVVAGMARDEEHLARIREQNFQSVMIVPLLARGRTLGAIDFITSVSGRRYTKDDLALAEDLARRCALALDNARLYREARDAVYARDQFLSIASHELRTPLTGIKGFAQVLLGAIGRGQIEPERLERSLQRIDDACNRLNELVQDLLDVSRIRTGQMRLRPHQMNFALLVRDVVTRYVEQLGDPHRLVLDVALDPCPVLVDMHRIEQVLTNLLDNAAKYSPQGGEIRVTVEASEGGVLLRVVDRGIGLPPGTAESIFEPFGRAANASARHIPGMGLGLYICREIAERHGGRIWAESAGEGQGTTLALWLPFADAAVLSERAAV
jgi:signal transduction histidine kinase